MRSYDTVPRVSVFNSVYFASTKNECDLLEKISAADKNKIIVILFR